MQASNLIEILRVAAPFGIKGAVHVVLYTNNLEQYNYLFSSNGEKFGFRILKLSGNVAIIALNNITNRNMAEKLCGQSLYIKKDDLPQLSESQFYICDLIGKSIRVLKTNKTLKILDVVNFGAGDLIELLKENDSTFYVPFTKENFPEFDGEMYLTAKAYEWFNN